MNFDDVGRIWREEGTEDFSRTRVEKLSTVRNRAAKRNTRTRRTAFTDTVAALIVILAFTYYAITAPSPLAQVGAIIIVVMGVIILIRWRAIRGQAPDPTLPVRLAIRAQLARLRAMERLQGTMEWYVGPIVAGVMLLLAGLSVSIGGDPVSVPVRVRMALYMTAFSGLVVFLNRRSLRLKVRPLREELESWLADLEDSDLEGVTDVH